MPRQELRYSKEAENSIKRFPERGSYSLETIHRLVNTSPLVHVALNPPGSPFPAIIPMIGHMGSFERPSASLGDPLDLYMHGSASARIFTTAGAATPPDGIPVCVAASHVDGLVFGLSAFNHSYNFRSAVLFGHATLVTDEAEKLYAMELITNKAMPERWEHCRLPTKAEIVSTGILRVSIKSASAKLRDGTANAEKQDLQSEEVMNSVWAGVVPLYTVAGDAIPSDFTRVAFPASGSEYFAQFAKDNEELAKTAVKKQ